MTEEDSKEIEERKKKMKQKKKAPKISFGEDTKPVTKGFAELFLQGFSESWADCFRNNKSLLHVDISHNHLPLTDVEIIAEGLKENQ